MFMTPFWEVEFFAVAADAVGFCAADSMPVFMAAGFSAPDFCAIEGIKIALVAMDAQTSAVVKETVFI
jgi:hypothetical protein